MGPLALRGTNRDVRQRQGHDTVRQMVRTGTVLDTGMIYFPAGRLPPLRQPARNGQQRRRGHTRHNHGHHFLLMTVAIGISKGTVFMTCGLG